MKFDPFHISQEKKQDKDSESLYEDIPATSQSEDMYEDIEGLQKHVVNQKDSEIKVSDNPGLICKVGLFLVL